MKKFSVQKAMSLKEFTDSTYPQGSFAFSVLLRERDIKVNGTRVSSDIMLTAGDEVVYYTTSAQENKISHTVVYEDENIIVCDKESGVSSEGLLSELSEDGSVYAVHRLDRNTRGLIVYAKKQRVMDELIAAFKSRRVQKIYLALCKNAFKKPAGKLTAYLKKHSDRARVDIFDNPVQGAEKIVTEYEVVRNSEELALVRIILHTGKTHQIRAHFAHIGCPVLGDEKYGDGELNKKYGARRQRLVAKELELELSGEYSYINGLRFESVYTPER